MIIIRKIQWLLIVTSMLLVVGCQQGSNPLTDAIVDVRVDFYDSVDPQDVSKVVAQISDQTVDPVVIIFEDEFTGFTELPLNFDVVYDGRTIDESKAYTFAVVVYQNQGGQEVETHANIISTTLPGPHMGTQKNFIVYPMP